MRCFIVALLMCLVVYSGPAFGKSYKFRSRTVTKNGKVVSSSLRASEVCPVCGKVHKFKTITKSK